jgi:hypothetical protein
MFNRHGVQHEQWVWDIRSEPGLVNVFAQIWGTDELLVSFGTYICVAEETATA